MDKSVIKTGLFNNRSAVVIIISLFLSLILIFPVVSKSQQNRFQNQHDIAELEGKSAARYITKKNASVTKTAASFNFNIYQYRCEWTIDPATRYISGAVTAFFTLTSNSNQIVFDLVDNLTVDSIYYHDKPIAGAGVRLISTV